MSVPLSPLLGEEDASFDGFAQADLIGENCPFGEGRPKGEERRFDLVRVEVDLRVCEGASKLLDGVGAGTLCELVGEVFRVICRRHKLRYL